jgi:RNA polymerase sigma-70 factor (sigma-E family)
VIGAEHREFVAFVHRSSAGLLGTAYLLTADRHAAEDLLQATLVRVFVAWERVRRAERPEAYVQTMLVNEQRRRWWRHRREHLAAELPEPGGGGGTPTSQVDDLLALRWALRQLPVRQRQAVVLRHYVRLSEAEAAESMGCSVGTVKSQTSRGLARLRALLDDEGREVAAATAGPADQIQSREGV